MSWPVAGVAVIAHLAFGDQAFPDGALLNAGLLAALAIIALAYTRPRQLPVLQVMLAYFYFAMGLTVFSPPKLDGVHGRIRLSSRALEEATLAALLFALTFTVVCLLGSRLCRRWSVPAGKLLDRRDAYAGSDTITARVVAAISVVIAVTIFTSPISQGIFGPFAHVSTVLANSAISAGLLYYDYHRTRSRLALWLFWGAVVLLSAAGMTTGMLSNAVYPWLTALVLIWSLDGKVPIVLLMCLIAGVVGLNSAKYAYRGLSWVGTRDITVAQQAENWIEAIDKTYEVGFESALQHSAQSTASRLSSMLQVAQIVSWVPARLPHDGPEQWLKTIFEFVPRAIWPEKPEHAREYNVRYTMLFELQNIRLANFTTLTLPSVGDGYWRLGWLGVLIEGAVLGILSGFYRALARPDSRALTLIATGFTVGTHPDQHVFNAVSGQLQYWIGMVAIILFVQWLPSLLESRAQDRIKVRRRSPNKPPTAFPTIERPPTR